MLKLLTGNVHVDMFGWLKIIESGIFPSASDKHNRTYNVSLITV